MSSNNNWEKYEFHVIQTLERLERKQDELFDYVRDHMEKEDARMDELGIRINKVETNAKWYARIFGGLWGVIVTGVNLWIGRNI